VDATDKALFPTEGFRFSVESDHMRTLLGADRDYDRTVVEGMAALTPLKKHTLLPNFTLATAWDTDPPLSRPLFLGGYPRFIGYAMEEFIANDYGRFQLVYRYSLTDKLYLKAIGNVGAVWRSLDDLLSREQQADLLWGGGVSLAWDTLIGPVDVALGLGENERLHLYVFYGYPF
jgi:outer membrane translocation and assembly module TamA